MTKSSPNSDSQMPSNLHLHPSRYNLPFQSVPIYEVEDFITKTTRADAKNGSQTWITFKDRVVSVTQPQPIIINKIQLPHFIPGMRGFSCRFLHQKWTPLYQKLLPIVVQFLVEISLVPYLPMPNKRRLELIFHFSFSN